MKKRFIAVIGNSNSGKSTIIQSLTGCKNHSIRDWVIDKREGNWLWVVCSSPQETPMSVNELKRIIREAVGKAKCVGLIVAIQPNSPKSRLSMEDVFVAVDVSGAFENYAYVISKGYEGNSRSFAETQDRVHGVSRNTEVYEIDGRKFAFQNASFIRASSELAI
jgi:energy-coupling factor transporter ATP-binding protein EcfA2